MQLSFFYVLSENNLQTTHYPCLEISSAFLH